MSLHSHSVRRWPLMLLAAPAAVAIWSGWVGLGTMSGFGLVQPLPGIVSWHLNTAITLPVGVEAYGAYALGAWLSLAVSHPARKFARNSAIGSLVLGILGQVAYHLLATAHAHRAPAVVVVLVACMPVVALGFGAALTHLLRMTPPEDIADPTVVLAGLASDIAGAVAALAAETGTPLAQSVPAAAAVPAVTEPAVPSRQDRAMPSPAGTAAERRAITAPRRATPPVPETVPGGPRPLKPGGHPDPVAIEAARDEWHAAFRRGQIHSDRSLEKAVNARFGYRVIGRTSAGSVIAAEREQRRTG